jgi:hypothetical protein
VKAILDEGRRHLYPDAISAGVLAALDEAGYMVCVRERRCGDPNEALNRVADDQYQQLKDAIQALVPPLPEPGPIHYVRGHDSESQVRELEVELETMRTERNALHKALVESRDHASRAVARVRELKVELATKERRRRETVEQRGSYKHQVGQKRARIEELEAALKGLLLVMENELPALRLPAGGHVHSVRSYEVYWKALRVLGQRVGHSVPTAAGQARGRGG